MLNPDDCGPEFEQEIKYRNYRTHEVRNEYFERISFLVVLQKLKQVCQCADINDAGKCTAARLSLGPRRAGEVARQQENPLCREQQQSSRAAEQQQQ